MGSTQRDQRLIKNFEVYASETTKATSMITLFIEKCSFLPNKHDTAFVNKSKNQVGLSLTRF